MVTVVASYVLVLAGKAHLSMVYLLCAVCLEHSLSLHCIA